MNRRDYGWIPLADLTTPHPSQLCEHSTEWLCRAKEQIPRRIAEMAQYTGHRPPEVDPETLARLMRARVIVEAELDERLARTLTELPDLVELHRQGYRHPGRTL